MDIANLKPGKQLNNLVAKYVMGWEPHSRNDAIYVDSKCVNGIITSTVSRTGVVNWLPSIYIDDAFRVVQKLQNQGYYININCHSNKYDYKNCYTCIIDGIVFETKKTLPLSICIASLLFKNPKELMKD